MYHIEKEDEFCYTIYNEFIHLIGTVFVTDTTELPNAIDELEKEIV